jgi:uncharacterized protein YndB with AHSA1/START domain
MTAIDTTAPAQTDSVSFDFDLPHSRRKVWRALTDPELMAEWLLPAIGVKLEQGAAFQLKTQAYPPWDGTVDCRFVEIEPQQKLSYTWTVGAMQLDTIVTFTLTPTPTGTRLSLVQSGFQPDQKKNSGGARYGWKMMGGKLIELLARTQ